MTFDNFSATWVYNAGTVCIFFLGRKVAYHAEPCIVQTHRGIVGPFFSYNGILESCGFECYIPVFHSRFQVRNPFGRCGWIDVVDNGMLRLGRQSFGVTGWVFGFQPVTVNQAFGLGFLLCVGENGKSILEIAYPIVCQTRTHRCFREQYHTGIQLECDFSALCSWIFS